MQEIDMHHMLKTMVSFVQLANDYLYTHSPPTHPPTHTHTHTCSYRNSMLHNICTEMLERGFHQSFAELFSLVERQRLDHQRAGAAAMLLEPLIEFNHTKLEQLRVKVYDYGPTKYTHVLYNVWVIILMLNPKILSYKILDLH